MLVKKYLVIIDEWDNIYPESGMDRSIMKEFSSFKDACDFYRAEKKYDFWYEDHWCQVQKPVPVWKWVPEKHKIHGNPAGNEYLAFYRKKSEEMDNFLNSLDEDSDVSFEKAIRSIFETHSEVKDIKIPYVEEQIELFDKGDVVF